MAKKQYKKFEDLVFEDWGGEERKKLEFINQTYLNHKQAVLNFDNGYGISVLLGVNFYSDGKDTYEVACLYDGELCYPEGTSFEDDVVGYAGKDEINDLMREIQDFKKK